MNSKPVFFESQFPDIDPSRLAPLEVEIHAKHDGTYQRMTHKVTVAEFDGLVDHLIKDLEQIRRDGHLWFRSANKKQGLSN